MSPRLLRLAMPPSRGNRFQTNGPELLGLFLDQPLSPDFVIKAHVCDDYATLSREVLEGLAELAWAPPILCARVERAGGLLVGRFQRKGLAKYRSALVCAKARPLDLAVQREVHAVWIDEESTGGYLLPHAHLLRQGVSILTQTFARTYPAALAAVAQGKADLTAVYATPATARQARTGLDDLPLGVRERLQIVAFTDEAPNDGLVVSPAVPAEVSLPLRTRLLEALRGNPAVYVLGQVFNAESLEPSPPGSYDALLRMVPSGAAK